MALQRCPNLIVLPTRFDVYRRSRGHPRILPIHVFDRNRFPLDGYLDVTAHPGAPAPLAQVIRGMIFRKTKLTSSAGIGPNKLIAKIASEINKPNGQFAVTPEDVPAFVEKLPVRKIWGIGEKTERKLEGSASKPAANCNASRVLILSIFSASSALSFMLFAAALITVRSNRIVRANHSAPRKRSLSI
jgi:DNA polymerase-4